MQAAWPSYVYGSQQNQRNSPLKTKIMFKSALSICALTFFSLFGSAQITQDRQVGDFTGLKVSSNIKVMLSQGDAVSVKVEAEEKDMADVKTEVKDGNLEIYGGGKEEVKVFVTVKT